MKTHRLTLTAAMALVTSAAAQGPLDPPSGPAPGMKSLQQIWDKIAALETQNQSLLTQNQALLTQTQALQTQNQTLLTTLASQQQTIGGITQRLEAAGISMPWQSSYIQSSSEEVSYECSFAFAPSGQPAVCYYDSTNSRLRYAIYNGSAWIRYTVETGGGGTQNSLAFSSTGQPAIAYYNSASGDLKYAISSNGGAAWTISTIAATNNVGQSPSLAFSPAGPPAVSHYDVTNADLVYTSFNGNFWTSTIVDSAGEVGRNSSLVFNPQGRPAISYYDEINGDLKFTVHTGTVWSLSIVADGQAPTSGSNGKGFSSSLAYTPAGQPAIAYSSSYYNSITGDLTGSLEYSVLEPGGWVRATVASDPAGSISLAFSPSGQPAIAYTVAPYWPEEQKYAAFNGAIWNTAVISALEGCQYNTLHFAPNGSPAIVASNLWTGALQYTTRLPSP
jgi:hypothetical protein